MIHNTKPFLQNRKAIQIPQSEFNGHLIDNLKTKRIVNVSTSRTDLLEVYTQRSNILPEKQIMMYDKDTDKSNLDNVNKVWSNLDYLGYTPVIQTGASYMDKQPILNTIWE